MDHPDSHSSFQLLLDRALQDYEKQTGTRLQDHPLTRQIEACDSVDSIAAIIQVQGQAFREFRGGGGKVMKSLKGSFHVLYAVLTITAIGEDACQPFQPGKVIFAGLAVLLAAIRDVSASYDALVDLFESIESFLGRLEIYTRIPPSATLMDIVAKIIVELFSTLALATKQVKLGRFKKFVRKLRGENDIEAVLQRLDRLTLDEAHATGAQTLKIVYGLVQNMSVAIDNTGYKASSDNIIRDALETMQEVVSKINKLERDKLQENVRKWLSPPDPWKNHNIARDSQHRGSAKWWIQGDTFAEWKYSGPSSLLWIHGKPGAGKSVLCSTIIQDIRRMRSSGLASLAFFYCDFRDDQKKGRRGLLSSLLVQLCDQSDACCAVLSKFYAGHGHGKQHASDGELVKCLYDMISSPGQATTFIVIDGLDECPATTGLPSPRDQVLELVKELVTLHIPNLRICITSRPEVDIVPILHPLAFCSVSLHHQSGQLEDIAEYVRSVVHTDPKMHAWREADKELVIGVLTGKADGMFRWVFCQLAYLRHCLPGRIRRALDELPKTLDETYERALKDIGDQNWEFAHRLFQCVSAASRPLRVEELAEFLAFDFDAGSTPMFLADWRPKDPGQAVLSTCSSLLAVVNVDGLSIIQFAHFSVKEYLTSERLANTNDTSISRFHISMTPAHTIVAQGCLGVLLHLDDKDTTRDSLETFPLLEYAAEHWLGHAQFESVSQHTEEGMKRLFDPRKHHLAIWVWVYDPEDPEDRFLCPEFSPRARATPLHYAALCGMHNLVKFLIVEHSQDVNTRGFDRNETPLGIACGKGHLEVTCVLLEYGADTETRDDRECSPLDRASQDGHIELIGVLLKHGANVNFEDENGYTALHVASFHGQPAVAQALIEYSADVNVQNSDGETPLHLASVNGHLDVVRVLLKHGAGTNLRDAKGKTPLHRAWSKRHLDIVSFLLQRSSDIYDQGPKGRAPVQSAATIGRHEDKQLLVEHGAEGQSTGLLWTLARWVGSQLSSWYPRI